MSRVASLALVVAAACVLTACASQVDAPISDSFGQAFATMDSQIIDPTPAVGPPGVSAARATQAIERYDTGKVLNPQLGTSAFQGGDAGSGAAGGAAAASSSGVSK